MNNTRTTANATPSDEARDERDAADILRMTERERKRLDKMAAKTKAECPWVEDGDILFA